MRRRAVLLFSSALLAPRAAPAQTTANRPAGALLPVVASFSVLADMLREVGGERVAVRAVVGPGGDAHSFQPRPSDSAALRGAALVVRNGLGLEPWLDRLLRSAGGDARVVTASDGVEARALADDHGHAHGAGAPDPHCWQDLRRGVRYVRNIAAGLADADPAGAADYRARADAYAARLLALDGWVRAQINAVPENKRRVVTSHDAFGYFGAAYGVRFSAPQGMSTEGEPSAAQVARLIRQVRADGTTAVFVENMSNPALLERLSREAGARVRGTLYSDALSPPDGPAATYEAMFRHNVGLLVPAMRGDA